MVSPRGSEFWLMGRPLKPLRESVHLHLRRFLVNFGIKKFPVNSEFRGHHRIWESGMNWHTLDNEEKIMTILHHLISKRTIVALRITGEETTFTSKLLKITETDLPPHIVAETGWKPEVIIEKLNPDRGNDLIQSSPDVIMEFKVKKNYCRCSVQNTGVSNIPPYFGLVMSIPQAIDIEEKREDERIVYDRPEFVSVEFRLKGGGEEGKIYSLNVLDRSERGFGLLITQKDFDLLKRLNPGVALKNMKFYSESIMITTDGIVRHKTRIEEGRYRGCYLLGIESVEAPRVEN